MSLIILKSIGHHYIYKKRSQIARIKQPSSFTEETREQLEQQHALIKKRED